MQNAIFCTILALSLSAAAYAQTGDEIGPGLYDKIMSIDLSRDRTFQIEAGKSHQFELLSRHPMQAGVYYKVNAPAKWSVKPSTGVKIDPKTGLFEAGKDVEHGTIFTVSAAVNLTTLWSREPRVWNVDQQVIVYDLRSNPLIGFWKQESATACGEASNEMAGDPIKELEFRADGTFSVTWNPFEVYKDYWGKYKYDLRSGALSFTADKGNNIPPNLDLDGRLLIEKNKLTLESVSLGTKDGYQSICSMTFEHY